MKKSELKQIIKEELKSLRENDNDHFGVVNISITGKSILKDRIIEDIRSILRKYQGEKHLFVDDKEINPYRSYSGGM